MWNKGKKPVDSEIKIECNQHIYRMTKDRTVRVSRDWSPNGRRAIGRSRKKSGETT